MKTADKTSSLQTSGPRASLLHKSWHSALLPVIAALLTTTASTKAQTIYIADQYDTSGSGAIYSTVPGGDNLLLYSGGLLNGPGYIRFDTSGNMFVSNVGPPGPFDSSTAGTSVIEITPGGVQSTFASGLGLPYGLAFDTGGNLFVGSFNSNTIDVFNPSGSVINTFSASLNGPAGMAFYNGNLYVTNYISGSVSEYSGNGALINGSVVTGVGGATDVAFDSSGNMFVAGQTAGVVNEYFAAGGSRTVASGISGVDAVLFDSQDNLLIGMAAAATGQNLYEITSASLASESPSTIVVGTGLPYDGLAIAPVPEPGGTLLFAIAGMLTLWKRRR